MVQAASFIHHEHEWRRPYYLVKQDKRVSLANRKVNSGFSDSRRCLEIEAVAMVTRANIIQTSRVITG